MAALGAGRALNFLALILANSCSSSSCWLAAWGLLRPRVISWGVWGIVTLICFPGETDLGLGLGFDLNLSGVPEWNFSTISAWDWNLLAGSAEWRLLRAASLKGTGWVTPAESRPGRE